MPDFTKSSKSLEHNQLDESKMAVRKPRKSLFQEVLAEGSVAKVGRGRGTVLPVPSFDPGHSHTQGTTHIWLKLAEEGEL